MLINLFLECRSSNRGVLQGVLVVQTREPRVFHDEEFVRSWTLPHSSRPWLAKPEHSIDS